MPLATLFQSGTVEDLAQIIRETSNNQSGIEQQNQLNNSWTSLVEIQPKGSKPPLFFIHPLGGEIFCYRNLALHLGLDQPVYGLQPQGLDGKAPLHTSIEDMAAHYIRKIQTFQPHGPYFLGGYSFGGMVAFEIARQFRQQGEKIGILTIFDTCLPGYSHQAPFLEIISDYITYFLRRRATNIQQKVQNWSWWINHDSQKRPQSFLEIKEYLPDADKHLEIIATNSQAASNYVFQMYSGSITIFRTEDKSRGELGVRYDPKFGWDNIVRGGLDIHYIPGSHISMLDEPYVQVFAEKLSACLIQAQSQ